jgi:major membrane immunogen (membrane-anchored lipoprotein)
MVQVYDNSNLLIFQQYFNTTICSGVTCSVKPAALGTLANGSYTWKVKDYSNAAGWASPVTTAFTLNIPIGTPTLGMPYGTLTSWDKSFNWSQVPNATFHYLEVKNSGGTVIFGTYFNLTICNGTTCRVSPPALANLANGTYTWRVKAYGSTGWGTFSAPTTFTLSIPSGATVTLNSPTGTLSSWDRYFRWTGIPGSTFYLIEVYNVSNVKIFSQWINLTSCSGLTCAFKPDALGTLPNGSYTWRMRDYSSTGYGPYTSYMPFVLNIP